MQADQHYQTFRVLRAWRRVKLGFKIVIGLFLGMLAVVAFVVHEYERMSRRRCNHH